MTRLGPLSAGIAMAFAVDACKGMRPGSLSQTDGATAAISLVDAGADAKHSATLVVSNRPPDDSMPAPAEEMTVRARHLLEAIANDNAALASDILFPRDGWSAMRDALDPGKDWDRRVAAPFRNAVHSLSRRHDDLARAQFVSLELGGAMAQATASAHGWKKALWTVHGSRLTFVVDGRTRTLPVRELTAWRGAWYVTRLR
jgi:hypothetical protein